MKKTIIGSAAIAALLAGPAMAQGLTANATTDLNLRTGPGPQYESVGVIDADGTVDVAGCLETADWCEVTYDGTTGWAYAAYLTTPVADQAEPVVLYENREVVQYDALAYERNEAVVGGSTGAGFGALAGSLIVGGPVAIAAGAAIGGLTALASALEPVTVTYVRENPVEPVYLDGEVVVGAGIPQDVTVYEIPDSDYSYLNVNNQTVIIEPEDRRVIRVVQ